VTTADERSAAYWKARARALEAVNRRLRERLVALAALLPPEYLDDLEMEPQPGKSRRPTPPVMNLGEESPFVTPAEVEPDIRGLWTRTTPPEHD
jgi:hypothetical protein